MEGRVETQTPCWQRQSPPPRFLGLVSLAQGSDCSVWLVFSYCSIHRVNIYALSVVVF